MKSNLNMEEIHEKVRMLGQPLLDQAGLDLVDLEIVMRHGDVAIAFMADKPTGGITIAECSRLNKAIVEAIDADGFLGENYTLEFSSPGLDRPLKTSKDFLRNMNFPVRVMLHSAVDAKREWTGKIIRVNTDEVVLLTKQKKEIVVPLTVVEKAVLVI